ncbi:MAG TPA: T9SS type A sorting domain-containing protein, partial [Paludibacteraceae bacterium]|nr:T9SS type A sorting domain-containing protein [Paludibacteraceae bacterium]
VTTSIGNLENASVNIYPNPSNGIFTISFGEIKSSAISLQIINTMGAVVYEEKISSNSPTTKMLNLKELPEGIYSVIIQAYNQRLMKKMTIIK